MSVCGFMDLLILQKWLTDYEGREGVSPSIIGILINFGLNAGKAPAGSQELPVIEH